MGLPAAPRVGSSSLGLCALWLSRLFGTLQRSTERRGRPLRRQQDREEASASPRDRLCRRLSWLCSAHNFLVGAGSHGPGAGKCRVARIPAHSFIVGALTCIECGSPRLPFAAVGSGYPGMGSFTAHGVDCRMGFTWGDSHFWQSPVCHVGGRSVASQNLHGRRDSRGPSRWVVRRLLKAETSVWILGGTHSRV